MKLLCVVFVLCFLTAVVVGEFSSLRVKRQFGRGGFDRGFGGPGRGFGGPGRGFGGPNRGFGRGGPVVVTKTVTKTEVIREAENNQHFLLLFVNIHKPSFHFF
uniref:Uncharacterized protein n=1 Tax=Ditylenchus dipsaci TaxID=166011 RepID=A0A915ESI6_9BILA